MAITQKSVGQEEFDFLQALWGNGNGAGGGTAGAGTGAGTGAGVGTIAGLIGKTLLEIGKRTSDKNYNIANPINNEVKQEKTLPINNIGQLDQIENWANQMVIDQPWNNYIPNNAIPQNNTIPKTQNKPTIKSQMGYRPMDIVAKEQWQVDGTAIPKDIPFDVIGGMEIPKDMPFDVINPSRPQALEQKEQWQVDGTAIPNDGTAIPNDGTAIPNDGTTIPNDGTAIPNIKQETMTDTKTKKPEIKPVEQQERDKGLPPIPYIPEGNNMEENVQQINYNNLQDVLRYLDEKQKEQWEREDAIRLETQQREDSAYQRAVADMRKSGVNPNLVGVNPADSGGGITQATGMDYSLYNAEVNKYVGLLQTELNNAFKEDENTKDRITDIIGGLINSVGWLIGIGISSKGKK